MSKPFHIAIDGPIAAGKGTVSMLIAKELGFLYIDTGAMYRTTALLAIKNDVDVADEQAVSQLLESAEIQMHNPLPEEQDGRNTTVLLNGHDVSWEIRAEGIGQASSQVAQHKQVRAILVAKQQQIAQDQNVVMEGRDITYRVLPNAQLKIYLTGIELVRAKRRYLQNIEKGNLENMDDVYRNLQERDHQDTHRVHDPLQIVENAWVIDTSDLSIDQVVRMIVERVRATFDSQI